MTNLDTFVHDFARGFEAADAKRPIAVNQRSGQAFGPGIGPHSETRTVDLVMQELSGLDPARYSRFETGVPYVTASRQKCDLCIGAPPSWEWVLEVKMLRLLGDNGQPNDNILMHILSPYPAHRSALTDCTKLFNSGLRGRKGIIIYGYEATDWPLSEAIDAFEVLARARAALGPRATAHFRNLVHPVHREGAVFGWELLGATAA